MQVTDVQLRPSTNGSIAKAFGKVVFDNVLSCDVTVMDKGEGPWVTFPGRKNPKDGKFYQHIYVIDKDIREVVNGKILEAFSALPSSGTETPDGLTPEDLPF